MAQATWHVLKCEAIRWRRANNPARAIECLVRAIEMTRPSPKLVRETGTMQNYLADLYFQEGQLPLAEGAIREALQTRLSLPVAEHSLAADDFIILAKVLSKQGKHREAFEAGNQGLGLFRKQSRADDKFIGHVRDMVEEFRRKLTRVDMEAQTSVPRNGRDRDRKIRDEPL